MFAEEKHQEEREGEGEEGQVIAGHQVFAELE